MAMSKILSQSLREETEEDVQDLVQLVRELNHHSDLAIKLSSTNKITKILNDDSNNIFSEI